MTLEILTSELLTPLRHGFFTRKGGTSSGVFSGLNCGTGSSDQTDVVTLNRSLVSEALGVEPDHLVTVHQTHSADVVVASQPFASPRPGADAIVTATPGLALGILTADCQPVLFADHKAGVVGVAHAGWKGALVGVLEATLDAMVGLGARRHDIAAVVGPTISQKHYEVGPEFLDAFLAKDTSFDRYFTAGRNDRLLFDLPRFGVDRLRDAGAGQVQSTGHCTYAAPELFYSFRRATHNGDADYGRLISAIVL